MAIAQPRTPLAGVLVALMTVFLLLVPAQAAADVTDADRSAFQSIITSQIEAFQRDDAATAFGFAAPSIKSIFRTPDVFIQMVKRGYMPVYRPRSYSFGSVTDETGGPTQRVSIVGPDGTLWLALYSMQRQPDGTWKISGVVLVKPKGESA